MNTLRIALVFILALFSASFTANAGKNKGDDKEIIIKAWFKDGTVYEGPMPKHWHTYRQTFLNPGHNFHTVPSDGSKKTVKREAKDTDSLLVVSSTHDAFAPGDFYVSFNGKSNFMGGKMMHKMLRRIKSGRKVELCKLKYIGNCMQGQLNLDQRMEYWLIRFRDSGEAVVFFDNPLEKRCHKPNLEAKAFAGYFKETNPALAEAVIKEFCSDKRKTREEIAEKVMENPEIFLEFVDNFMTEAK